MRRRLCDPFGAHLLVDAGERPDAHTLAAELRSAIVDHHVVVLRAASLDRDAFLALARCLGAPYQAPGLTNPVLGHGLELVEISANPGGLLGSGPLPAHSDHAFTPTPSMGALAYCLRASERGGVTSWADLQLAYARLPLELQAQARELEAWAYNPWAGPEALREVAGPRQVFAQRDAPRVHHPVVRVHPESGKPSLYLSSLTRGMRRRADGAPVDPELLHRLVRATNAPELYLHHTWEAGDLVFWDNRCTNHRRSAFDPSSGRTLWRYQLAGETPRAFEPSAAEADGADP